MRNTMCHTATGTAVVSFSLLSLLATLVGCGDASNANSPSGTNPAVAQATGSETPVDPAQERDLQSGRTVQGHLQSESEARRLLADILVDDVEAAPPEIESPKIELDNNRLQRHGIRRVEGKHLILLTDLPASPEVDELPKVFDAAVPLWCEHFNISKTRLGRWRMVGCVMKDRTRFQAAGVLHAGLPAFRYGFQSGQWFWLEEQPSAYYRRHLLLHEGTHGFMFLNLGGAGPPWYSEGMAELLGTHRWQDGKLTLGIMPGDSNDVPYWGRIKIIRDAYAAKEGLRLEDVMSYDSRAHRDLQPYAWCWAATKFLSEHPRYQASFQELKKRVRNTGSEFSQYFHHLLKDDWKELQIEWEVFVAHLDYGYDVTANAIEFRRGEPALAPVEAKIQANRGWQSTGVWLETGKEYELRASGRFQLARQMIAGEEKVWWCEAGGVTIRYHNGLPLGMLVGAIQPDVTGDSGSPSPLAQPRPIGLGRQIRPRVSGTLYLKVNDSPSELRDNAGELTITVIPR